MNIKYNYQKRDSIILLTICFGIAVLFIVSGIQLPMQWGTATDVQPTLSQATSVAATASNQDYNAPQGGEVLTAPGAVTTYYYLQTDWRWGKLTYGEGSDTIGKQGCGPTSMAIVVSSLTDTKIDPLQMSEWAYKNGYWYPRSGSLHTIVNGTAKAFGLKSEGVGNNKETAERICTTLKNGGMVVALMGKGHFTRGGHFIVLRGITEEGKILIADCNDIENTLIEWDLELLQKEAKSAADGGPFWIIE